MVRPNQPQSMPASSFKPVETRRLYQHVADQIRTLIQSGHHAPGSKLPAERELAQQLGVSRPSLREALIALELEARVEIRMGSGVYVCSPPERAADLSATLGESPSELMQARAVLEGAVAVLAAARVTVPGLARVRESLEAMRADLTRGRAPVEHDRRFHLAIAELAGNPVLQRLVGELFDERHSPLSAKLRVHSESTRTWGAALAEHEAVFQALEARDPHAAEAAMRLHLKASAERWVGMGQETGTG